MNINVILTIVEKYVAAHPEVLEKLIEALVERILSKLSPAQDVAKAA